MLVARYDPLRSVTPESEGIMCFLCSPLRSVTIRYAKNGWINVFLCSPLRSVTIRYASVMQKLEGVMDNSAIRYRTPRLAFIMIKGNGVVWGRDGMRWRLGRSLAL